MLSADQIVNRGLLTTPDIPSNTQVGHIYKPSYITQIIMLLKFFNLKTTL
jgi:hypothetical protein